MAATLTVNQMAMFRDLAEQIEASIQVGEMTPAEALAVIDLLAALLRPRIPGGNDGSN